jgi:DNA-directed RNA polymerase specialized sigma24 family protein
MDSMAVLRALGEVAEPYQAPLALFYLEECSYKEIEEILEVPLGTVQSRISRGLVQLQRILLRGRTSAVELKKEHPEHPG